MLALHTITLDTPDLDAAGSFYAAALSVRVTQREHTAECDIPGAARFKVRASGEHASGFRGYVVSYILAQPSEVEAVSQAAARNGVRVLRAPKKGFFGGFSAVFQAPDGAIWKLAAPTKKDTAPTADPPIPTEMGVILAVAEPRVSQAVLQRFGNDGGPGLRQ